MVPEQISASSARKWSWSTTLAVLTGRVGSLGIRATKRVVPPAAMLFLQPRSLGRTQVLPRRPWRSWRPVKETSLRSAFSHQTMTCWPEEEV